LLFLPVPVTVKINKPKVNKPGNNNNNNNNAAGAGKKLQRRPNSGKGAKAKTNAGPNNKKKGAAAAGAKREKEAPVSSMDLDKQMAACKCVSEGVRLPSDDRCSNAASGCCSALDWHKAGKGPDPEKMELDQQLEAYRMATATTAAEAPAASESS
jgi:hypothetical protein